MNSFDVYVITHIASGKQYVGCTKKGYARRWRTHLSDARTAERPKHSALLRAIIKYGPESFRVQLLETVGDYETLLAREVEWIARLGTIAPNGFNLTRGGEGVVELNEECRERLRQAARGRKTFLGRTHSAETKAKMVAAALASWPPERREKISAALVGRQFSEETKRRISQSKTGVKLPPLSAAQRIVVSRAKCRPTGCPFNVPLPPCVRAANRRFDVRVQIDGKRVYMGRFPTAGEAFDAYVAAVSRSAG